MKSLRLVLSALTVLFLAASAHAQTKVKADVPFDFVVGDRLYHAGEYSLKPANDLGSVIRIENAQELPVGNILSNACSASTPSAQTKLVFHRMGNMYFLYQIWKEGDSSGREFPRGKSETRLAQLHDGPDTVIVAANISK